MKIRDHKLLQKAVAESVNIYNIEIPHLSCSLKYPEDVHKEIR